VPLPPDRLPPQQRAEKHLKAYSVFREVDFPYTHNILRLLELCPREEGGGAEETVTREETLRAIEVAVRVRQAVRDALARAGVHPAGEPPS
jgi:HEPN domain-containing protein